jgi:hypothetical protein
MRAQDLLFEGRRKSFRSAPFMGKPLRKVLTLPLLQQVGSSDGGFLGRSGR